MLTTMFPAVLLVALAFFAGRALLRVAGVGKGLLGLALAPSLGLAVLAIAATWCDLLGAPPIASTLAVFIIAAAGVVVTVEQAPSLPRVRLDRALDRVFWACVALTVLLPLVIVAVALGQVQAPLSQFDGANHVEIMQALRTGTAGSSWYPPGIHALFAAVLLALPWLDTAEGGYQLALGLTLLAPTAAFGLGLALWRNAPLAAASGGVLIAVSYFFPYGLQIWSGWPLAAAILLSIGLWAAAIEFLHEPRLGWVVIVGLMGGALVLVHGTEIYTAAIGLAVFGIAEWRRLPFARLPRDLAIAAAAAVASALPYFKTLAAWLALGGALSVGAEVAFAARQHVDLPGQLRLALTQFSDVDPPIHVALLALGIWWALRTREARSLVALLGVFVGLIVIFSFEQIPIVAALFAHLYPWALEYRLSYIVIIVSRLLEGGGVCALLWIGSRAWERRRAWRMVHPVAARRLHHALIVLPSSLLVISAVSVMVVLAGAADGVNAYSADDAAAMAWLHAHARPGELLANDFSADAGIWAPAKAGVAIVEPRELPVLPDLDQRELLLRNIGRLEDAPDAQAAACRFNVRYVYSGAAGTGWEDRQFPSAAELRQSSALEEVFRSGDAVVFRTRLECAP
jgi:hypothetical protein